MNLAIKSIVSMISLSNAKVTDPTPNKKAVELDMPTCKAFEPYQFNPNEFIQSYGLDMSSLDTVAQLLTADLNTSPTTNLSKMRS